MATIEHVAWPFVQRGPSDKAERGRVVSVAYPLVGGVLVLLRLLNAIPVRLVRLVVRRVVLGLGHGSESAGRSFQSVPGRVSQAERAAREWAARRTCLSSENHEEEGRGRAHPVVSSSRCLEQERRAALAEGESDSLVHLGQRKKSGKLSCAQGDPARDHTYIDCGPTSADRPSAA